MFFHPRKVSILNIYRLSTSFFCCELNAPETHRRRWRGRRSLEVAEITRCELSRTFRATWTFIFISLVTGSHQPRGRCWGKIVHGKVIESLWRSRGVRNRNFQGKIFFEDEKVLTDDFEADFWLNSLRFLQDSTCPTAPAIPSSVRENFRRELFSNISKFNKNLRQTRHTQTFTSYQRRRTDFARVKMECVERSFQG